MFNPPLLFEQNSYLCRKYENSNEKDIPHPYGRFAHGFPFGFGLLAYSRGFVRTEDSYDKAFGKGAALTLLTLGSYTVIPHKYETHGGVIIVDSLNDNIVALTPGPSP